MNTEYNVLLKNPKWLKKRKVILERDGNKCQCCRATNLLHVHHKQYQINEQTGDFQLPWDYQNKLLITLCENCHKAGHSKYKVPIFKIS